MNKYLLIPLLGLSLVGASLHAQMKTAGGGPAFKNSGIQDSIYDKPFLKRPLSVSVHAGTQGVGLSAKLKFAPRWYLRLGASTLPVNYNINDVTDGYHTNIKLDANFTNVHLLAEWQPFKTQNIRLVGGLGYFVSGSVKGTLAPTGKYTFGELQVASETIGKIDATLDWKGVAPYLGIGLFKSQPRHKFGASADLGTYYMVSQIVAMSGTKLLSNSNASQDQFKQNMNDYRWLPVLQVNLTYKLQN